MIRIVLLLLVLVLPTTCFGFMVGGACEYQELLGTARIIEEDGHLVARFYPAPVAGQKKVENAGLHGMKFVLEDNHGWISDKHYPAQLSAITEGSCTPYRFLMLASPDFSHGIFLPFDKEGQLSTEGHDRLQQIAFTLKKLSGSWPQLQLDLCGQTGPEGTEEYNLALGQRYAAQARQQLEDVGIPAGWLQTSSTGEAPCPHCAVFSDELSNGVWAAFSLKGSVQDSQSSGTQKTYAAADVVQLKGVLYEKKTRQKIDGVVLSYSRSGVLLQELLCVDGKPDGITKEYYPSGALKNELVYQDGLYHGLSKTYYETGELSSEVPSRNDLLHGTVILYNQDGSIASQEAYVDGVLQEEQ